MPELTIRYRPGIVPGEYVERQLRRTSDIIGKILNVNSNQVCPEARPFGQGADNYADEEVGLIATPSRILDRAKHIEIVSRNLRVLKLEERHNDLEQASKCVARAVMKEWIVDPDADLYRLPNGQPTHETIVTIYPIAFGHVSSKEFQP